MGETITKSFESWTAYDDWLIVNYAYYNITSLNEIEGKIVAEYNQKEGVEIPEENK